MFRPASGCPQHLKAGQNTQHLSSVRLFLSSLETWFSGDRLVLWWGNFPASSFVSRTEDNALSIPKPKNIISMKNLTKMAQVVSSGSFHAFYVILFPLEYIPSIPPHSKYVIVNGFSWFQNKKCPHNKSSLWCMLNEKV